MKIEISKDLSGLYKQTLPWDFNNPPMDIIDLAESMVKLMLEKKAIGLAANQCGFPYSIFCMNTVPESYFCINPRIVNMSGELISGPEGCLSYPSLLLQLKRFNEVRLRFSAPDGQTYTKIFKGMTSRVIQHEILHLEGKAFFQGLISKTKLEIAIKKAKKRGFDYSNLGLLKYSS